MYSEMFWPRCLLSKHERDGMARPNKQRCHQGQSVKQEFAAKDKAKKANAKAATKPSKKAA
jgi:hypothetical protein